MPLSDIDADERVLFLVHGHPGLIDREFADLCGDWRGVLEQAAALPCVALPGAPEPTGSEEVTGPSTDGRTPLEAGGVR